MGSKIGAFKFGDMVALMLPLFGYRSLKTFTGL